MKKLSEWHRADSADAELLRRCKRELTEAVGPVEVILYGSRARQEVAWDRDMDLLVLLPGPVTKPLRARIDEKLLDIEMDAEVAISSIVMDESEFDPDQDGSTPWSRNVGREGVVA